MFFGKTVHKNSCYQWMALNVISYSFSNLHKLNWFSASQRLVYLSYSFLFFRTWSGYVFNKLILSCLGIVSGIRVYETFSLRAETTGLAHQNMADLQTTWNLRWLETSTLTDWPILTNGDFPNLEIPFFVFGIKHRGAQNVRQKWNVK